MIIEGRGVIDDHHAILISHEHAHEQDVGLLYSRKRILSAEETKLTPHTLKFHQYE